MPRSYLITKSEYQLFDEALEEIKDLIQNGATVSSYSLRTILSKLQKVHPTPIASGFTPPNGDAA